MTTHTTTDLPFAELPEAEQRARAQAIQDAERDRYWAAKRAAAGRRETARTARAMGGKVMGGKRRLPAPNRADLRAQGVRNTRPRRLTAGSPPRRHRSSTPTAHSAASPTAPSAAPPACPST